MNLLNLRGQDERKNMKGPFGEKKIILIYMIISKEKTQRYCNNFGGARAPH